MSHSTPGPARTGQRRLWASILGVIAVAGILLGFNLVADTRFATTELDLTEQHIYTLSEGTRAVLAGLKEPITLRLFYSHQIGASLPAFGAYADRVREMLTRYAALSHGMLRVEFYDPEPYSETEERAAAYGLQSAPLDAGGEQAWFGLVGTNLLDDQRIIAGFHTDRERFLEYDLTNLIHDLSNPERPLVGLMTPLPIDADAGSLVARNSFASVVGTYISVQMLRRDFSVERVPTDATVIDPKVKVLVVAQPMDLSDAALYAIDQFVMHGGRLLAMVDPQSDVMSVMPDQTGAPQVVTPSNLKKLFDAWGIGFDTEQVVGDPVGAWHVRSGSGDQEQAVAYVPWFSIRDGINHDDPALAALSQVTVASPGAVTKLPGAAIEFTPLLTSSPESGFIAANDLRGEVVPAKVLAAFHQGGGARVIAARIRGRLHSAFAAPPAGSTDSTYKAETDGPANLVVVGDTDLLADRFWVNGHSLADAQPFADNAAFVTNVVGSLAGGDALASLRSRGTVERPFTLLEDMRTQAESRFRKTEQALQAHLADTQKKLAGLRTTDAAGAVLTEEQRGAIDDLRRDIADTRDRLRDVQLDLRHDIGRLETRLRLFNIVLVPAVLTLLAIVLGLVRSRQRARARA